MSREPIVLVNGFFDPITDGHIDLFRAANKYGHVYVLVNGNDLAVQKKDFYFMDEKVRCKIVDSIVYVVAATVCHDQEEWETIIWELEPEYFFFDGDKGSITSLDPIIPKICDDIGCGIVFGGNKKINSSSRLLKNYANWVLDHPNEFS